MERSLSALFLDQHMTAQSEQSKEELRQLLACARLELELARAAAVAENSALESRSRCLLEQLERVQRERDESNKQCRQMQEQLTSLSASSSSPPHLKDIPPLHSPTSGIIGSELPSWMLSDICPNLPKHHNGNPNPNPSPTPFHLDHSGYHLDLQDVDALLPWGEEEREGNPESIDDSRVSVATQLQEPQEPNIEVAPTSLPERGKFMKAIIDAGPLLQHLLVTGPLPEWKFPPPPLTSSYLPSLEHGFSFNPVNARIPHRINPDTALPRRFGKIL